MTKTKSLTWFQTFKTSTAVENFTSLIKKCYAKLPKLSKKKVLAGGLLFLQGVSSSHQGNSQELALVNNDVNTLNVNNNFVPGYNLNATNNFGNPHTQLVPFHGEAKPVSSSDVSQFIINNYKALDLDVDASEEELKKNYKRLSLKYHPDKFIISQLTIEEATENFRVIQNAYENLQKIFNLSRLNESELVTQIQAQIENSERKSIMDNEHKKITHNFNRPGLNFPGQNINGFLMTSTSSSRGFLGGSFFVGAQPLAKPAHNSFANHVSIVKNVASSANHIVSTTSSFVNFSLSVASTYGAYKIVEGVLTSLEEPDIEPNADQIIPGQTETIEERKEKDPINENPEEPTKKLDAELQAKAIAIVNKHWAKNATNGKINGQSKEEVLNHGLTPPTDTWEKDIQTQTGKEAIETKRDIYLQKIDLAKQKELEKVFEEEEEEEDKTQPERESNNDESSNEKSSRKFQTKQTKSSNQNSQTSTDKSSRNTFKEVGLPIIGVISVVGAVALIVAKLVVVAKPTKKL